MWMMDSGIAYDTKPQNDRAAVISVSSAEKTESVRISSAGYEVPEEKIAPKDRLKEKTEKAIAFLQSEETAEKVNSLKKKATSAVNQAGAKTSDIVSGAVSFLQSEETAEKVNSLKEKATSAVNQAGAKTSDIVSDAVSFFKPESSDKKLVIDEEKTQPVFSSPDFHQQNHDETLVRNPQSGVLYAIIGILSLIIIIGGIVLFTYIKKISDSHEVSVSNAPAEPGQNQFAENSMEIPITEASVPVSVASQNTAVLLSSGTGTSNEKVYQDFYQILQSSDFVDAPGGYLYDIDHDGKDDMILKDTDKMDFILYTHDSSGNLSMTHFGSFLAWGDDDFYDITGTDGIHYIYYYDEYMHHSIQGVFNPQTGNELDFSDGYSEEEIQNLLSQAGFQTKGGNYSKLEMLYYDALCQKTAPVETVPATEKRNSPEISCEIKTVQEYEGYSYTLYVKGNYDYYHIECREYGFDDSNGYQVLSENNTKSSLYLTAASSIDHVTATVTPYYSDGTSGQTRTCTANQPKPVISVSVSSCNKKGEINGRGVAGFTTSYVVNGGAKTTVRDELGNHWHVTAKNYCSAYGITWYELWDSDDGDYYGWVDSNYISFYSGNSSSSSVEVHSFDNYGEINGYGVPGYTTSYVVNGGSKSTVRKELGNGWHVTAVKYCYSHGISWYELYDTDDGDYYGWVDGNYIRFYAN